MLNSFAVTKLYVPLELMVLHHVVGLKLLKPSLPPRFRMIQDMTILDPFWIHSGTLNLKVSQLDELEPTEICCTKLRKES